MIKTKVVDLIKWCILHQLPGPHSIFSLRYGHIEFCPFPKGFLKENPAGGAPWEGAQRGVWGPKNHEKMTFPEMSQMSSYGVSKPWGCIETLLTVALRPPLPPFPPPLSPP